MHFPCGRLLQDANNSLALPPSCSVGSLWLLARHGTRNPGSKDKQKMETLLPRLRDKIVAAWGAGESGLQSEQVEALRGWRWSKGEEKDNILTSTGHLEHWLLGRRFGEQLRELGLDISLENNRTRVSSSSKQRARASAESFLDGLQGIPDGHNSSVEEFRYPDVVTDDQLLRYYMNCPKYQKEVISSY